MIRLGAALMVLMPLRPGQDTVAAWGSTVHMRRCGAEVQATREMPGDRARRWVVERTHAWMTRFRRRLIRWEKKVANDLAWLHVAWAWITCRAAELFGSALILQW
jgi:putative transposase